MKALYKVPTLARSIFTQKQARKNKLYNIVLLVDESGSMGTSKASQAAEATIFLAKNFEGININFCVIGFNKNISILKDWDTKIDYDKVYDDIRTCHHSNGYGDNNDYDALYRGYQIFDKAPKGQNILIMMSDGAPEQTSSKYYDVKGNKEDKAVIERNMKKLSISDKHDRQHLHALVNANKDVVSIGVGIQEGGWQVPDHFVVHDLDQLKPQIIKALKNKIKRG